MFKGGTISYSNFPIQPHMKGTTDISTGKYNTLFLPTKSLIWKISLDLSLPDSSWELVMEGDFLEGYSRVLVHQKWFPPGGYVVDNTNSLFLLKLGMITSLICCISYIEFNIIYIYISLKYYQLTLLKFSGNSL